MASLLRTATSAAAALVVLSTGVVAVTQAGDVEACPPGTQRAADADVGISPDLALTDDPVLSGVSGGEFQDVAGALCVPVSGPESFGDMRLAFEQRANMRMGMDGFLAAGALQAAAESAAALVDNTDVVPGARGKWELYGRGPLRFDDGRYPSGSGQGLVDQTGRVDHFFHDAQNDRIFASVGTGGVWMSEDRGDSWKHISQGLPIQSVSGTIWTPEGGPMGTVVTVTGEHSFGSASYLGFGVWYSRDLGQSWNRSSGPLDGAFGFDMEVDPANQNIVYAATGKGLWRSTDAGVTFEDTLLPVGDVGDGTDCTGKYDQEICHLANMVTSVEIKAPGGVGSDTDGSDVIAAVGWRGGDFVNAKTGTKQAPGNGIYLSSDGAPGTFTKSGGLASAVGGQDVLGRIEMGAAFGDDQDHDIVYAIVQDARALNGQVIDFPDSLNPLGGGPATVLRGVFVSTDFGASWSTLASEDELADACNINLSVYCISGAIEPGAQSWYNQWIEPDPTTADPFTGAPLRVLMGLEEVWSTRGFIPQISEATTFEVIGRYYGCLTILNVQPPGGQCDLAAAGVTTTHPDQHAALMLPDDDGNVTVLVGNDGGVARQTVDANTPFNQLNWELDQNNGLQTLLPYEADIANDGTAYMALQDNGQLRIHPEERQFMSSQFGGDGVWTRVDPENSLYVWESVQGAAMNVSADGGVTWASADPPSPNKQFVPAAEMDPLDSFHIVAGGSQINENILGPGARDANWLTVFDLGNNELQPEGAPTVANIQHAIDVYGAAIYAGYCGTCDTLNSTNAFQNGIATNVDGLELPEIGTINGWHKIDRPEGLPNRFITGMAIDPYDATQRTVYVTLGGYRREWHGPGVLGDDNPEVDADAGNVWKSIDAGRSFTPVGENLPDITVVDVIVRGDQLIVATDIGGFISADKNNGLWAPLGGDQFRSVPIEGLTLKADDDDFLFVSTFGAGTWVYEFPRGDQTIRRTAGSTRHETSALISAQEFDSATTVVIARGDSFADALAGAPLAARNDAPVLLIKTSGVPAPVAAEIDRLGAANAIVLGGESAVSAEAVTELENLGLTVRRISGESRFDTAAAIAAELVDDGDGILGETFVYIAKGIDVDPNRGWEDAMAVAAAAAKDQRPILLAKTDELPQATIDAIDAFANPVAAKIAGGRVAISREVERELQELVDYRGRVSGFTRYGTSVNAVDEGLAGGLTSDRLFLARGDNFADALAAAAAVARDGGSLLLVRGDSLADSRESGVYLNHIICATDEITILGGPNAISDAFLRDVSVTRNGCERVPVAAPPTPNPVLGPPPPPSTEVRSQLASYDFEADADGWTTSSAFGSNPQGGWSRQGDGIDSSFAWHITPESYGPEVETYVTSPALNGVGGKVYVGWDEIVDIEGGTYDEVYVEVSTDGGSTWSNVSTSGGRNSSFPEADRRETSFSVPAGAFQVRFQFSSDSLCQPSPPDAQCPPEADPYTGYVMDNVVIEEVSS